MTGRIDWGPSSAIYCYGPILDAVQTRKLFADSKTFVDMKMKTDPAKILNDFEAINRNSELSDSQLRQFVEEHFSRPEQELDTWTPDDWTATPTLAERVVDPNFRQWVYELNNRWTILGRKMNVAVIENPDRHSLLPVPKPFIVPGDRFRELYYWDSYWIIGGLLECNMASTTRGMLENFLHFVKTYGHIPNGGRVYYLCRSQPPLLSVMMNLYHSATGDDSFIMENLHLLEKEYSFWVENRTVVVKSGKTGISHKLSRYAVNLKTPRPEGYLEDLNLTRAMSADEAKVKFSELASACESGWDFSSRWFKPGSQDLNSIQTSQIIPVDLNAFLYQVETILAKFNQISGQSEKVAFYSAAAKARDVAIHEILWSESDGVWMDFDLSANQHRQHFYPSNIFPLYAGCYGSAVGRTKCGVADKVVEYLQKHRLTDYPGGIPASELDTGLQWDFPNTWPNLVHIVVEALASVDDHPVAQELAFTLAQNWLRSAWKTFRTHKHMFEKYDCRVDNAAGHGGEYAVQLGFGWSNGTALMLLNKYADRLKVDVN